MILHVLLKTDKRVILWLVMPFMAVLQCSVEVVMLLLAHGASRGVVMDHVRPVIFVNQWLYVAGTVSFRLDTVFAGLGVTGQSYHRFQNLRMR